MKQLIWDLPTRIFHWLLAGSVLGAYAFAQLAPEDSPLFYLHILFAMTAGLLIIWRIAWGVLGSKHARFSSLVFSPVEVKDYFASVLAGKGRYYAGHNPGGALAVWAMFAFIVLAIGSGLGMGFFGEFFEEPHEVLTNLLMVVVAVHVLGVVLATVMHKENYVGAMVTGRKRAEAGEAIPSARPISAAALVVFVALGVGYLAKSFDFGTGVFQPLGTSLQLKFGEGEHEGGGHRGEDHHGHGDDDDGDDD